MAVAITPGGVSGTVSHGSSITIPGSGFGTKSTAAPVMWDNCDKTVNSSAAITSAGWQYPAPRPPGQTEASSLQYKATPYRSVNAPHGLVNKVMTGLCDTGYNYDHLVCKTRTLAAFPAQVFASWYETCDPAWSIGDNLKTFGWGAGGGAWEGTYWYCSYNPSITTKTGDNGEYMVSYGMSPDPAWNMKVGSPHNILNRWVHHDAALLVTQTQTGYLRVWDDGTLHGDLTNYQTDMIAGMDRSFWIGGYTNAMGTSQWRYFSDLYLDWTFQRVVIGNANTWANCTKYAIQIPSAWSATSITATVNRGEFGASESAWLYVFDATNTPNTSGYAVTFGGAPPPTPPVGTITLSVR
jgi:hypothetical protein